MTGSDEHLLGQVVAGDQGAFMALYDRFAPRAFGLLTRIIGDRAEAEDVLQEVMVQVWRRAASFDPALGSVKTWVLMQARSRALDRVRSRRRERDRLAAVSVDRLAAASVDRPKEFPGPAVAALRWSEPGADVLLDRLPQEQAEAIRLAFYHGLSREEISVATGAPVGTVKTRIRSGIRRLCTMLQEASEPVP